MKKMNDFAWHLSSFLGKYLAGEKNMSTNTIAAYRDAFRLFLLFCEEKKGIRPDRITLSFLTKELITDYLDWLEQERGCSIVTRNQRLSSIHGFLKYVQKELPENLFEIQRILGISSKKTKRTIVPYLTEDELKILFQQPNTKTKHGRRDLVLLVLMYDSAARVQELVDLRVRDIRLTAPAVVTLHGKGRKTRQVPIIGKTKELLSGYLEQHKKMAWGIAAADAPMFYNQQLQKLSRWGISHILEKYVELAKQETSFQVDFPVTPHVLRHSKAMGMLKAGVNLIYIRDFLGHSNVVTTEIYARADTEMKRKALESTYKELQTETLPNWNEDDDLMLWLQDLCK
ncbi:tyrosine-type recombinase/integrase [Paenibacillus alginolyticus]|uniref:Site-specific integrase n=1 Tax=Paenibacillus alginolyticus TaxID=59839 RepID=A0ABT4GQC8_9BACL|nr:tyrosine-type recombinase/integrase [Paenibacillus alginolyticus]MCY9698397.1 site-specific integrase [Paenibacillus alginolyticus]MEC0146703.1 tyrosine-type recombinase/integrase [Paenibacillus alginolyticus]